MNDHKGRVTRSNKPKKGKPKRTNGGTSELWDRLREGAKTSYGDGALIISHWCNGWRRAEIDLNKSRRDSLGYRDYSTVSTSKKKPVKGNSSPERVDTKIPKRLLKLAEFCNKNPDKIVPDKLFAFLRIPEMYQIAYSKLKSNPGNMTPGINPQTLDGISLRWVDETIHKIANKTFEFQPGIRVMIPKSNGKMRPLTVAPPRDKIVQEVIRMVLETIFEPTFSKNSHGFRPNLSCHTALRQVKTQFGSASFYLEGDISKCFDSFSHRILMRIIEEKIKDRQFTALIWKALRAGYFEFHQTQSSIVGTPQGSVLSPLLANIYLHALDIFMEKRIDGYNQGKAAKINPAYKALDYQQSKASQGGDSLEALKFMKLKQLIPSRIHADPNFRRMYYVRYADDWIVAIRGPRADAVQLLLDVKDFLNKELELDLSMEKTKITDPTSESALFLGTEITISSHVYSAKGKHGHHLRVPSQIRLLAPMNRIYKKLNAAGLINIQSGRGIPRFLWLPLSKDTIIRMYNSVLRGYLNYYSFTHNYNRVAASLTHLLRESCAKLLAAKFNLRNRARVIKKYGQDLKGVGQYCIPKTRP